MLTSDLLFSRRRGAEVYPKFIKDRNSPWAQSVLAVMTEHQQKTRGELHSALRALEGDSPDYRLVRGFARLALAGAEFTPAQTEPEPEQLRHRVFELAAADSRGFGERQAADAIAEAAVSYDISPQAYTDALYADLPDRHLLTVLPDFTPETLVDRYNLAQAQGLLYSALYLRIIAYRNVPGEYRRLFHRLKFHGLLYAIEGNLDDGYQIYVDGPASLFKQTRKYGIQMAVFLPALLNITRWQMEAVLIHKDRQVSYRLDSESPLRNNREPPPEYDSLLEKSFAERWQKSKSCRDWQLEREVEIIDLKGTVFAPDFALRHADGRIVHIEIMGFWHPDYLRRKLDKVRRAAREDLILAVSDRLNVGSHDTEDILGPVIFFKGKLDPKQVLSVLETRYPASAGAPASS